MTKAEKNVKRMMKASDKKSVDYWKQVRDRGKQFLKNPLVFYPLLVGAIYIDFTQIRAGILNSGAAFNVATLTQIAVLVAVLLNAGMKVLMWLGSQDKKTIASYILMAFLSITILGSYVVTCSIKWTTRYIDTETQMSSSVMANDPAAALMGQTSGVDMGNGLETFESEPEHNIGIDLTTLLSCCVPLITSTFIAGISYDADPHRKERFKLLKKRKELVDNRNEFVNEIRVREESLDYLEEEKREIRALIEKEKAEGVDMFKKYLAVHARYQLAKHLGSPEALTYLIQENAYVDALFPGEHA